MLASVTSMAWRLETWALEFEAWVRVCRWLPPKHVPHVSSPFISLGLSLLACEVGGQLLLLLCGG